jgi:hypothetical protein
MVMRRERPDAALTEQVASEAFVPPPVEVEFVAYAEDSILSGRVALTADRLTDLLNDHDQYTLVDVLVESLVDGRAIERREVLVDRDELSIVHLLGPRGSSDRRIRTRQHPVAVQLGPYHVRGYLHALPGSNPIDSIRRRPPMVPLTDAWIEHFVGDVLQRRRVSAVLVNRHLMDWIVEAKDDEVEMPDIPIAAGGPLAKDFTGAVHVEPADEDDDDAAISLTA